MLFKVSPTIPSTEGSYVAKPRISGQGNTLCFLVRRASDMTGCVCRRVACRIRTVNAIHLTNIAHPPKNTCEVCPQNVLSNVLVGV